MRSGMLRVSKLFYARYTQLSMLLHITANAGDAFIPGKKSTGCCAVPRIQFSPAVPGGLTCL